MKKQIESSHEYSTAQVAEQLGLAVRSVQLMVDRGELEAWKTPGGHRRISRSSVERWKALRRGEKVAEPRPSPVSNAASSNEPVVHGARRHASVLVIEDSKHYQRLISMLLQDQFPNVDVRLADDGISGLALAGELQPRLLIVDILLPGIDGGTLIMGLRSLPQFAARRLIVVTSLDEAGRAPYRLALEGIPVVEKARLVLDLPGRLQEVLGQVAATAGRA
jgi:excisionase family DNA binding protein